MDKIFDELGKSYSPNVVVYAKKLFSLVDNMPLPKFGQNTTGVGKHPNMRDPYWISKDVPKYANLDEWKVDVAISLAVSINALATVSGSSPLPTQKTVNDWFALSSLVDGGLNAVLSTYAMQATFLYNQNDKVFNAFKAKMMSGDLNSHMMAQYAELMETGEFYNPAMDSAMGINFSIIKHPFWKDVAQKLQDGPTSQPLPEGTPINPDSLPVPENSGGLTLTVDLPQSQVDKLVELYIGFFGRAAENQGLEHWKGDLNQLLKSGLNEEQAFVEISNKFWEAAKQFSNITGYNENMTNFDFVAKVYSNVLGRPDAVTNDREGVDYWTKVMTDSGVTKGQMVLMVLDGAHYYIDDKPNDPIAKYVDSLLNNRTDISLFFAQDSISGNLKGNAAIKMGVDVINRIDQNKSSVNNVKNALQNDTLYNLPEIDLVGTGTVPTALEGFIM